MTTDPVLHHFFGECGFDHGPELAVAVATRARIFFEFLLSIRKGWGHKRERNASSF